MVNRKMKLKEKTMSSMLLVAPLAVLANLFWGSAVPLIKIGYGLFSISAEDTASQLLFAGCRFTIAGFLALALGTILNGKFPAPKRGSFPKIAVLALFQTVMQYVFFYIGCAHTSGTKASIAASCAVFFSILVSSLLFRLEKLSFRKICGCFLGFSGVALINISGGTLDLNMSLLGEGCILLSTFAFAMSGSITKIYSRTEDPVMLCGWQFVLGGLVLAALGCALGGRLLIPSSGAIMLVVYLGLVSAVAFSITSLLMKYNPVSKVFVFNFLNPVFGVILSIVLLGESGQDFGLRGITALVLVCLGVLTVNYSGKKNRDIVSKP